MWGLPSHGSEDVMTFSFTWRWRLYEVQICVAVKIQILIFRVITVCIGHWQFGGKCLSFRNEWRQYNLRQLFLSHLCSDIPDFTVSVENKTVLTKKFSAGWIQGMLLSLVRICCLCRCVLKRQYYDLACSLYVSLRCCGAP